MQNIPYTHPNGSGESMKSKRYAIGNTNHIIKPRHNGMSLIRAHPSYWRVVEWQIPTRRALNVEHLYKKRLLQKNN